MYMYMCIYQRSCVADLLFCPCFMDAKAKTFKKIDR